jgi:hypothetical protein
MNLPALFNFKHPLEGIQDALALGKEIPLQFPKQVWHPIDDFLLCKTHSIGPSGKNIWILYKENDGLYVSCYLNWSGCRSSLENIKKRGAVLWADALDPVIPLQE